MEYIIVEAEPREKKGSRFCKRLLKDGMIPAVLYGLEKDPIMLSLKETNIRTIQKSHSPIVDLRVGDNSQRVLVKEIQYDTFCDRALHVDFCHVAMDAVLTISVEIRIVGNAKGVMQGGVMSQEVYEVDVEALPTNIPEYIDVNVTDLGIDEQIRMKDIPLPPGVRILEDAEAIVVAVQQPLPEEEEAPKPVEEGQKEPELIRRAKAEENAEEER